MGFFVTGGGGWKWLVAGCWVGGRDSFDWQDVGKK